LVAQKKKKFFFVDEVACADPVECKATCGNEGGCTNIAYPRLVMELLPTGIKKIFETDFLLI
jgi:hypothetical protein